MSPEAIALYTVVWMVGGNLLCAEHYGMPFGSVASVWAWHRVGNLLELVVVVLALAPIFRYVDDFFGASLCGIFWSGGKLLAVVGGLLGLPTDALKDSDDCFEMVVLGVLVSL